jgi:putative transposase
MYITYKSNNNVVYSCKYHVVWCPKYRRKILINTSKVLKSEYPSLKTKIPSLWTNSYFVSTVGGAPLDVIKQYIENQKTSQRQKYKLG